jgi:hypothetical protein
MLPVPMVGCQFQIKRLQVIHHALNGKVFANELLAELSEALPQRGIID